MSRTTRVRLVNTRLQGFLAGQNAVMAVDAGLLTGVADRVATGCSLSASEQDLVSVSAQVLMGEGLVVETPATPDLLQDPDAIRLLADIAVVEQRERIATVLDSTLRAAGWTVTVVPGREPQSFTGLEATRGDEHLLAALGAGEVITDQCGAVDCVATVSEIKEALREIGCELRLENDVVHDGGGGPLYGLHGGPSRAHAIEAQLKPSRSRSRSGPSRASDEDMRDGRAQRERA